MHDTCQSLIPLTISVTISIFMVSAFIFFTLCPNDPIIITAVPQHIINLVHCIGYTALLKTLHSPFW